MDKDRFIAALPWLALVLCNIGASILLAYMLFYG